MDSSLLMRLYNNLFRPYLNSNPNWFKSLALDELRRPWRESLLYPNVNTNRLGLIIGQESTVPITESKQFLQAYPDLIRPDLPWSIHNHPVQLEGVPSLPAFTSIPKQYLPDSFVPNTVPSPNDVLFGESGNQNLVEVMGNDFMNNNNPSITSLFNPSGFGNESGRTLQTIQRLMKVLLDPQNVPTGNLPTAFPEFTNIGNGNFYIKTSPIQTHPLLGPWFNQF